jgi:hypothetical protein
MATIAYLQLDELARIATRLPVSRQQDRTAHAITLAFDADDDLIGVAVDDVHRHLRQR